MSAGYCPQRHPAPCELGCALGSICGLLRAATPGENDVLPLYPRPVKNGPLVVNVELSRLREDAMRAAGEMP